MMPLRNSLRFISRLQDGECSKSFELIKVLHIYYGIVQNTNWHKRSNCQADCKKNSNILIARLEPFQVLATKHRNGENEDKL